MELATTTSTAIQDFILSVLIVLSDIVFKWIPAAVTVITGHPPTLTGFASDSDTAALLAKNVLQQTGHATQVAVQGTYIDSSGVPTATPVDGSIQAVNAAPAVHISPLSFASDTLSTAWHIFAPLSIFISLLLAMALVYAMVRFFQVRFAEKQALHAMARPVVAPASISVVPGVVVPTGPTGMQKRWARIQDQIASPDENDWRLAILEADIVLGDALTARGYREGSIGDQLKQARQEPVGDFRTLDQAWDAHITRNNIAHRGSTHDLNQREARRVIGEFEQVFREFGLL